MKEYDRTSGFYFSTCPYTNFDDSNEEEHGYLYLNTPRSDMVVSIHRTKLLNISRN